MDFPTPGMYLTPVPQEELLRLKNDCEIPDVPTQLTYHLRRAASGGGDPAPPALFSYQPLLSLQNHEPH